MTVDVPYPFVRCTAVIHDFDSEGPSETTVQSWRPGTETEARGREGEYTDFFADAMGAMRLNEVQACPMPKPYQERVFYTRQWVDPEGKVFGKAHLRVTTRGAFTRLKAGYRFPFEIQPVPVAAGSPTRTT